MRTRLVTALALGGLAVTLSLVTYTRLSARDVNVPSDPKPAKEDIPNTCLETCGPTAPIGEWVAEKIPTMLVNSRKIRLNYGVSEVGPSGVAAVELWATRDGRSWQRYSNEPPPAGPLVVHVAEEGRYGFSIVVRSGVGLTSPTPETGDAPQLWVEVDETKPDVKIKDVTAGIGREANTLFIRWNASDVHIVPHPVTISMATTKDGPWTPVASSLENTGIFGWEMPKDLPYQFYIKVDAEDRAGNVGCACTLEPIKIDTSRPRGTILGVESDRKPVTKTESIEGFFIGHTR